MEAGVAGEMARKNNVVDFVLASQRTGRPELVRRVRALVLPRSQTREFETNFCARMVGEATSQNLSDEFVQASNNEG